MGIRIKNICCIGAGYVGGPSCAVLANQLPHVQVSVVDSSVDRIKAWNSSRLPIYEPDLQDIVEQCRYESSSRRLNLHFSNDIQGAIGTADLIFIAVNTPTKTHGIGAGKATDLTFVEAVAHEIAKVATSDKIIVEKSTVPCRTADILKDIFEAAGRPGVHFEVLSNPEFLAEGTAVKDLLEPDRILIGSEETETGLKAAAALAEIYAAWIPRERIVTMNIWSSELSKLAANCMLAQRISSINSLSALCEVTGADIAEIAHAVGLDDRLGPKFLKASVGFGGSCFKKDLLSLVYMAETAHLPEVAAYWSAVVDINEWQQERFTGRIIASLNNTLARKKVAVLGLAYKKDTADFRDSPSIGCIGQMIAENAKVAVFDPKVDMQQFRDDLRKKYGDELVDRCVICCEDAYEACDNAAAVVLLTDWDEFRNDKELPAEPTLCTKEPRLRCTKMHGNAERLEDEPYLQDSIAEQYTEQGFETPPTSVECWSTDSLDSLDTKTARSDGRLDWSRVAKHMRRPRLVFDGRGVVDAAKLEALGFVVHSIGKTRGPKRCRRG